LADVNDIKKFFLTRQMKDENITGHSVSLDETNQVRPVQQNETVEHTDETVAEPDSFKDVFRKFAAVMRTYRNFLTLTLQLVPEVSRHLSGMRVSEFARRKGVERSDLSNNEMSVFELPINSFREFMSHNDEIEAAVHGARHLPEVMIIGLISAYDAFLSELLRVVFNANLAIVLTSEKTIKFSDLIAYKQMDAARNALIDREIEALLRESHHQQFLSLEEKLSVKLREGLAVWPKFVELCERRNLLTHTGGIVSHQYLTVCSKHKCDVSSVAVGDKLKIDHAYFAEAVHIISEIGLKLCYVLWRKFEKGNRDGADSVLCDECYNLIVNRNYKTAEAILSFGYEVLSKSGSEKTRRMMIVNLANSLRLQGKESNAKKLLDREDWGAVSDDFAIGVAAVRGDVSEVASLMRRIGNNGRPNIEDYRTWPVFRGIRSKSEFQAAFLEVFGEPVTVAGAAAPSISPTASVH
jgi:hypothetical protein